MTDPASTSVDPLSPCEKVCTLNPDNRTCMGCFRTADEIRDWRGYSRAEKHAVLARLPARREARRLERKARIRRRRASR